MARRKRFLSSEDELFTGTITERARSEFQSYLSDNEELPEAPEALGGLEELEGLEASEGLESPDAAPDTMMLNTPEPPEQPLSSDVALPEADYGRSPPLSSGSTDGITNHRTNGNFHGIIGRVRAVDIEVPLPWLSRRRRATFRRVEVPAEETTPEATPEAERYPARRSRRLVVRTLAFLMILLSF
ncbi:hypothetical protein B0H67DRAFT_576648 [Lasiosphaeris hirsuta]|uniref:Uncharacterized protein n=1 Tax=Lasiosphaeris hirsuta TaxID=260670 RepID=A0AA40ARC6_9PEZI|nr:hypothetical protein B0H67DRAFT_576648 [Lasiosphaeris hirsuta]